MDKEEKVAEEEFKRGGGVVGGSEKLKNIYIFKIMDDLTIAQKALHTAKWAKIMSKWLITYSTKSKKKWQLVSFEGAKGNESAGIIDIIAIRRDYSNKTNEIKKGDLFEIVLIQVKGGTAQMPKKNDVERMKKVGEYYNAKAIVLFEWKRSKVLNVFKLENSEWIKIQEIEIF